MMRGIWCPRHPGAKLVRTNLPSGKFDLRCPGCTEDRIAAIRVVASEGVPFMGGAPKIGPPDPPKAE
jgi:hypothetical protein